MLDIYFQFIDFKYKAVTVGFQEINFIWNGTETT
jgi:hypothetical protein